MTNNRTELFLGIEQDLTAREAQISEFLARMYWFHCRRALMSISFHNEDCCRRCCRCSC